MIFLHSTFLNEFGTYLELGFSHILDIQGYDHILFIITLCAIYQFREWKKILVLVTAFTIGHSVTLALAALNLILIPQGVIDVLIPTTIFLTAVHNIRQRDLLKGSRLFDSKQAFNYSMALFFGLIHGMGFSNYFKFLLGEENSIVNQLFAFNVGLELGQIIVVASFMALLFAFTRFFQAQHREWNLVISGAGAGIALTIIIDTLFAV
jgi:hypothetical protein